MKVRGQGNITEAFELGSAEQNENTPEWFRERVSSRDITMTRGADGKIKALIGNSVANEGDWIVLAMTDIMVVKADVFHKNYVKVNTP